MMKKKKGKIINIGSTDGHYASRFAAAYCASKGAVRSLTQALAIEWTRYNINVNCVVPGNTITDLSPVPDMAPVRMDDQTREKMAQDVPMRRWATPEEIAVPAIYLASDLSDFVTGESIVIDGGVLAGR